MREQLAIKPEFNRIRKEAELLARRHVSAPFKK